jgi:hypothetical protein
VPTGFRARKEGKRRKEKQKENRERSRLIHLFNVPSMEINAAFNFVYLSLKGKN